MKKPLPTATELRHHAEDRLRAAPPGTARDEEAQRMLHELQVHQIELEMQNEELVLSRAKLEASAERYADLYDFAPVSYLTLDLGGAIHEANLTASTYLGVNREQLIGQSFPHFLAAQSRALFRAFLEKTANSDTKETCEVTLPAKDGPPRRARLEGLAFAAGAGEGRHCRLILHDITEHTREAAEIRGLLATSERTRRSQLDLIEDLNGSEEALRESQAHLRFTLESARLGDWNLDLTTDTARRSLRHDQCFGYTEPVADWGLEKFIAHVHPEDRAWVERGFRAATTDLTPWDFECRVIWPDGSTHWISARGDIYRKEGKPVRMLGIVTDITERKQTEAALRASEANMAEAQRIGHFGSWEVELLEPDDHHANPLRWSDEVFRIFGLEPSAFGATFDVFLAAVHPADRERLEAAQRRALAGAENLNLEYRVVRPDGTLRWVRELGELKRDDTGRATRLTGTVLDITERKTIEAERDNLFNYSEDLFCIGTFDGRLVQLNPAWTNLLGWSLAEMQNRPWLDFVHPDDHEATIRAGEQLVQGQPVRGHENRYLCKDGSYRWLAWNSHPLVEAQQIFGVVRDITERKRADEVLRISESRLRSIIETEPECVKVVSREGLLLEMNRAGLAMLQADSLADVQKQTLMEFIVPDYHAGFRGLHQQVMAGRDGLLTFEIIGLKGRHRWLETHATPLRNAVGEVESLLGVTRDITERKEAEAAARASESKFRQLAESNILGILFWNTQGHITDANDAFLRMFGYTREELASGQIDWRNMTPPEFQHLDERALVEIATTGSCTPFEKEYFHKEGRRVAIVIGAAALDGAKDQGICYVVDISAQKQAEAELQRSEHEQRQLAQQLAAEKARLLEAQAVAKIGSWETDLATGVVKWSEETHRIFETDPNSFSPTHQAFLQRVHPDDRTMVDEAFVRSFAIRTTCAITHRVLMADGRIKFVEERWQIFPDGQGQPSRAIGTCHDITARKLAEAALRESEERLRLALDAAQMGTFDWEVPANRITWSRWHEEIWGFQPGEFGGTFEAFAERLHPADLPELNAEVARCMAAHEGFAREFRVVWPDGSVHWVQGRGEFTFDAGGQPVRMRGAVIEVTARKQAEDEVRRLNAELEQRVIERTAQLEAANKELEAFSYSVSHDLRAPLRAVDGFALAVLEDYGALLPDEGRVYLQTVRDGTQKMGALIDDLLTFSRLGRASLKTQTVDTTALVRMVLDDLEGQRSGRKIAIRVDDLPPCEGDTALLRQVWVNLLSNALKYTQKREGAEVEIGCEIGKTENVYFVKDNGSGFDMRYAGKLFGVFQRFHLAEDYEGTGVGLAIVQRIIHRHGGRIWAEAEVDRGATFFFTLSGAVK